VNVDTRFDRHAAPRFAGARRRPVDRGVVDGDRESQQAAYRLPAEFNPDFGRHPRCGFVDCMIGTAFRQRVQGDREVACVTAASGKFALAAHLG
jgi:hypothetical protein